MNMRKMVNWVVALALLVVATGVQAQTTATNAITLIDDNIVNARDTMVPLAIGAAVLFIGISAGVKFWKKIFGHG